VGGSVDSNELMENGGNHRQIASEKQVINFFVMNIQLSLYTPHQFYYY